MESVSRRAACAARVNPTSATDARIPIDFFHRLAAFRGEGPSAEPAVRRPSPELLPAAERRRAPDTVALALEVAAHAVAQSGLRSAELLSVFCSCHGDLAINDYLCSTLVSAPLMISPTRFHNSVHNAASGYWTVATGCMQASTAVSAFESSFAAGLLEALAQCAAETRPVLQVGCDIGACAALASTNASRGLLAAALVIAPGRSARSQAALPLGANAMADAVPLFEALARADPAPLPLSATLALRLQLGAMTRWSA